MLWNRVGQQGVFVQKKQLAILGFIHKQASGSPTSRPCGTGFRRLIFTFHFQIFS
jgi:hypothetical protein